MVFQITVVTDQALGAQADQLGRTEPFNLFRMQVAVEFSILVEQSTLPIKTLPFIVTLHWSVATLPYLAYSSTTFCKDTIL